MSRTLQRELGKRNAFDSVGQEAWLAVARTADVLGRGFDDLFRRRGLTSPQYNVLRILRGSRPSPDAAATTGRGAGAVTAGTAGDPGLTCGEIAGRMVSRASDLTRLLDKLDRAGMVARHRPAEDRRTIRVRITPAGLRVLAELDGPVADLHRRQLAGVDEAKLRTLVRLLDTVRAAVRAAEGDGDAGVPPHSSRTPPVRRPRATPKRSPR